MQYGGGWAKHAYGDLHPLSNRRQRRTVAIPDDEAPARFRPGRRRYRPTRRHLLQKLESVERQVKEYAERGKDNRGDCLDDLRDDFLRRRMKRKENILAELAKLVERD